MDPRWQKITLRMLLQHTAGWDRAKSFDPIGRYNAIATTFETKPPVPPELVIRYMMGHPLDFDPGTRYAYANVDYLLLGRAIEKASGQGYEAFVKKEVLVPLGVTGPRLGRALPENRTAGEVSYYDHKRRQGTCLYPPHAGKMVPIPDGAENFEAYEAHGGWIASAIDLVRFASAFDDPKACPLLKEATIAAMWARPAGDAGHEADGKPKAAYYGCGWNFRPVADGRGNAWHGGLISGTSTLLYRRWDNLCWAVLFNSNANPDGQVLSGMIDGPLHEAAAKVRAWPDKDLFAKYLKGA
jgi:N-acyl-D-amino-acid deacylase